MVRKWQSKTTGRNNGFAIGEIMTDKEIIVELLLMFAKDNELTWEELRVYNHVTCIATNRIVQDN